MLPNAVHAMELLAMEQETPKASTIPAYDQLLDLFNQNIPPAANPIAVEKGFGQTFDYASLLNPEGNVSEAIYERRLKNFKRYLFDYIDNKSSTIAKGRAHREIQSGCVINFLRNYNRSLIAQSKTKSFLPQFKDQFSKEHLVTNFMPSSAFKEDGGGIPWKTNDGLIGYSLFAMIRGGKTRIDALDKAAMRTLTLKAQKEGKEIVISNSKPLFILTEPDAENICFTLGQPEFAKKPLQKRTQILVDLAKLPALSQQAKRILNCYAFNLITTKLDLITNAQMKRKKHEPKTEDKRPFDMCLMQCPHILKLAGFEKYLLSFLSSPEKIDLSKWKKNHADLCNHIARFDQLSLEYTILYDRMQKELKELKLKKKTIAKNEEEIESDEEALIEEIELKEEPEVVDEVIENLTPIKYDDRICRWYRIAFTKTQSIASIFYHTALPRIADEIVRRFGKKSPHNNKTNKGQVDDLYTMSGKIKNNGTDVELFYKFAMCIDPKGICYHRECKKCTWEELQKEQPFDFQEELLGDTDGPEIQEHDQIVVETDTYTIITNSMHNCTITLYKPL
jgi:hypothetical protein